MTEFSLYDESAMLYDTHLAQHFDYKAASERSQSLLNTVAPHAQTLLDLACGTGGHLEYFRHRYQCEGLDLSLPMLAQARTRLSDVTFHEANMISFDLGRRFDVITCMYGSIAFLQTLENVVAMLRCVAGHLHDNGAVLVEPWWAPEQLLEGEVRVDSTETPDGQIVSMYKIESEGTLSIFDIHYLVCTGAEVQHFVERETLGLFTREQYLDAFRQAGLTAVFHDVDLFPGHRYGAYLATKTEDT